MVVQTFFVGDAPSAVAVVEQGSLMRVYGREYNAKFFSDLLRTETSRKGLEDFELGWGCFVYDIGTISTFLGFHLGTLLFLRRAEGLSHIGNIGTQRNKRAFNQFDACIGGDMHHLTFIGLLLNC